MARDERKPTQQPPLIHAAGLNIGVMMRVSYGLRKRGAPREGRARSF